MSMGPCGDSLGLTMSTVYALSVFQLPLTFLFVLEFRPVHIDIFSTSVKIVPNPATNGTGVDLHDPTLLHYSHSIGISAVFMLQSAAVAFFGIITMYLADKGLQMGSGNEDVDSIGYEVIPAGARVVVRARVHTGT